MHSCVTEQMLQACRLVVGTGPCINRSEGRWSQRQDLLNSSAFRVSLVKISHCHARFPLLHKGVPRRLAGTLVEMAGRSCITLHHLFTQKVERTSEPYQPALLASDLDRWT